MVSCCSRRSDSRWRAVQSCERTTGAEPGERPGRHPPWDLSSRPVRTNSCGPAPKRRPPGSCSGRYCRRAGTVERPGRTGGSQTTCATRPGATTFSSLRSSSSARMGWLRLAISRRAVRCASSPRPTPGSRGFPRARFRMGARWGRPRFSTPTAGHAEPATWRAVADRERRGKLE
jgi:hypothetical protein